ncbi:MAG: creatininase family protein [Candidatus Freyarchaeota archaeon]|nr:creatininase family protein [Candidatus Jordarchaeia archaeon]MBS7267661.1 creatininase family protein [Candidatus Jordarchaeia archaeon]MBS7278940.1 creatininase family protein [Candidatus Jordarchaeia archaeon]
MNHVLLPIGSTEQHGPHLPLGTDTYIAKRISEALAAELKIDLVPTLSYGVSAEHAGFPGTIGIQSKTLLKVLKDISESLLKRYQKIIIINSHGGNTSTLQRLKNEKIVIVDLFQTLKGILENLRETDMGGICHACEAETSLMLYLKPDLVRREKITEDIVKYVPQLDPQSKSPLPNGWKTINYSQSGVIGDPTKATPEKGKKIFEALIRKMSEILETLLT